MKQRISVLGGHAPLSSSTFIGARDVTHWRTVAGGLLLDRYRRVSGPFTAQQALAGSLILGGVIAAAAAGGATAVYDAVTDRDGVEGLDRPALAGLSLFAFFVKSWVSRSEISARYRAGVYASMGIAGVAFLSYVLLALEFAIGYDQRGDEWAPNANAILSWIPRYMDWSTTVPILMIELIAVSALLGSVARRVRFIAVAAAFLMIVTGYIGGVIIDDGQNLTALWTWGVISGVFMVILCVIIITTVVASNRVIRSREARTSYRNAMIVLLITWFAYPVVFGLQGWGHGGTVTTWMQVILSASDIIVKVGFGVLIHKVSKLRTAEDLLTGDDTHPESVWISSVKHASGRQPVIENPAPAPAAALLPEPNS